MCGFISGLSILFHWSIFLSLCQYQTVLMTVACSRAWSQAGWFLQFHSSFSGLLWLFEGFLCISIQIVKLFIPALWKIPLVALWGLHWIYRLFWVVYSFSLYWFFHPWTWFISPSISVIFDFYDHNALKLDLNYRRKTIKNSNIWRLNNTLLNNQQITEEIKKEIIICIETNENENTAMQNLWDTIKAVLRGKFIAIQAYLKKQEKSQINNLTLHLKQLEKEE